ncbi:prostate androgen-regulated mucin-like protein 1 [Dromaius novaehollandiae]|uniref:prostate androgen-regulated mucin-like protein 1 n=1 Tax=Dromaius novaehollandiae TaxID=8790 RepID=UPI000E1F539E|nr:prostate androgen-regulated mucin-like protein 1 [Dromaius novaehollandiae]
MGCRRLLLLALLLLPAGFSDDVAMPSLSASHPPTPSTGIPTRTDAVFGTVASPAMSTPPMSSGATEWEGSSTVHTATADSTGPSTSSSTGWEPSAARSAPASWLASAATTVTGGAAEEPITASSTTAATSSQPGTPSPPSRTTAGSSSAPLPSSAQPLRPSSSPPVPENTPSRGTPTTVAAWPGPASPQVTATVDKISPTTSFATQEAPRALSSGSVVAITVTVIVMVVLVFGVAAYLKIRHSSYGRLLDDHDYGSWGNYNNPLYDDS